MAHRKRGNTWARNEEAIGSSLSFSYATDAVCEDTAPTTEELDRSSSHTFRRRIHPYSITSSASASEFGSFGISSSISELPNPHAGWVSAAFDDDGSTKISEATKTQPIKPSGRISSELKGVTLNKLNFSMYVCVTPQRWT